MKNFFKTLLILTGASLGLAVAGLAVQRYFVNMGETYGFWVRPVLYMGLILIGTIIFWIFSEKWASWLTRFITNTENDIKVASSKTVFYNAAGIAIGIILAYFFSHIVSRLGDGPFVFFVDIIIYVIFIYLAVIVATKLSEGRGRENSEENETVNGNTVKHYYVDTSSLIDGRILDLLRTGLLEGEVIIPGFILSELQNIADSDDDLRREKGRRGLDVLNRMIATFNDDTLSVKVENYTDYDRENTDMSLINVARENEGRIITLDYNLNQVATANGIRVININDISNALKMPVMSGDEIEVMIIKRGRERQQGIGYMQDGTMIVVEDAADRIGDTVLAEITSALQTSAGRMIFADLIK